jgi:hypothetical protein
MGYNFQKLIMKMIIISMEKEDQVLGKTLMDLWLLKRRRYLRMLILLNILNSKTQEASALQIQNILKDITT